MICFTIPAIAASSLGVGNGCVSVSDARATNGRATLGRRPAVTANAVLFKNVRRVIGFMVDRD
jgi:hypothetical protein